MIDGKLLNVLLVCQWWSRTREVNKRIARPWNIKGNHNQHFKKKNFCFENKTRHGLIELISRERNDMPSNTECENLIAARFIYDRDNTRALQKANRLPLSYVYKKISPKTCPPSLLLSGPSTNLKTVYCESTNA